ncbi:acetate uptake transporter [Conexibacter sp. DBS9H8]|uniref:acetate uptake transporter n=1 Tax=Conexibacter sp. DBS9H8 TaxID=2937801 RepID=UPI00200E67A5|nr:acetate uptake transporter [Conexibacter sp. DBS9H8]
MATISEPQRGSGAVAPTGASGATQGWLPANPAPLGLSGFGITTLMLSMMNANLVSFSHDVEVVLGMALAYGGLCQLLAGMWEFRAGNIFGAVAFSSYGAFWISFFVLVSFDLGKVGGGAAGVDAGLGLYLWAWAIFTGMMFLCSFANARAVQAVFLFLTLTFVFLGIGNSGGSASMIHIGGYLGIITAALALYTACGEIMAVVYKHDVLPLGRPTPHN